MTKKELWAIFTRRNPSFEGGGNVTMSARGLRKLFDTTWDIAMYQGEEERYEDEEDSQPMPGQGDAAFESLMRAFFGK